MARAALAGKVFAPVGYATHYHADYVVPYWATELAKTAVQGTHIFYRWLGYWGTPPAFARSHSGTEPDPRRLGHAALQRRGAGHLATEAASAGDGPLVATDPQVELVSIVQLLAAKSEPSDDDSPYQRRVREHFAPFGNHVAVEIYRQLVAAGRGLDAAASLHSLTHYSAPPKLELLGPVPRELLRSAGGKAKLDGLLLALRDLTAHSDFATFSRKQQAFYEELEGQARERVSALLANPGGRLCRCCSTRSNWWIGPINAGAEPRSLPSASKAMTRA